MRGPGQVERRTQLQFLIYLNFNSACSDMQARPIPIRRIRHAVARESPARPLKVSCSRSSIRRSKEALFALGNIFHFRSALQPFVFRQKTVRSYNGRSFQYACNIFAIERSICSSGLPPAADRNVAVGPSYDRLIAVARLGNAGHRTIRVPTPPSQYEFLTREGQFLRNARRRVRW